MILNKIPERVLECVDGQHFRQAHRYVSAK